MKTSLEKFYAFLNQPLKLWSRPILALLVVPLALSFTAPLWKIRLEAPQYPKGLELDIYSYTLEGGDGGRHLNEINTLNHYIGMHRIDRSELSDLDWIPFALGFLAFVTLRVAAVGDVRSLIDLLVLSMYLGAFSGGRFVYKMYVYGHNLAPDAAVKVEPFTPALFGTKQIANFTTISYPQLGTWYILIFATGVVVLTGWHLVAGRLEAKRKGALAESAVKPAAAA